MAPGYSPSSSRPPRAFDVAKGEAARVRQRPHAHTHTAAGSPEGSRCVQTKKEAEREKRQKRYAGLRLLDEFGLETHGADALDLAVDVVIAVDKADVLHLGAHFHDLA